MSNMTSYRLLAGEHLEPIRGADPEQHVKVKAGETFESTQEWYADRYPEKFQKIDGASSSYQWNPDTESIEEFVERMKARKPNLPPTPPTPQGFDKTYESMTVKELQEEAKKEGISVHGLTKKEDIIKKLEASLQDV